jgi:hypothetical protein
MKKSLWENYENPLRSPPRVVGGRAGVLEDPAGLVLSDLEIGQILEMQVKDRVWKGIHFTERWK